LKLEVFQYNTFCEQIIYQNKIEHHFRTRPTPRIVIQLKQTKHKKRELLMNKNIQGRQDKTALLKF
jgi:hypothetical protein